MEIRFPYINVSFWALGGFGISGTLIVIADESKKELLPINAPMLEGQLLASYLQQVTTRRPLTHQLMNNLFSKLNIKIEKIVISDLRDNTFYATIHYTCGGIKYTQDSRPSDAIILAVISRVFIYIEEEVIKKYKETLEDLKYQEMLASLDPDKMYKM